MQPLSQEVWSGSSRISTCGHILNSRRSLPGKDERTPHIERERERERPCPGGDLGDVSRIRVLEQTQVLVLRISSILWSIGRLARIDTGWIHTDVATFRKGRSTVRWARCRSHCVVNLKSSYHCACLNKALLCRLDNREPVSTGWIYLGNCAIRFLASISLKELPCVCICAINA